MIINDLKIISKSDLSPNQFFYTSIELESEFVKTFKIKDAIFLYDGRVTFSDYKYSIYASNIGFKFFKHNAMFHSKTSIPILYPEVPILYPEDFIKAEKVLSDPEVPKEIKKVILLNLDRFV